MSRSEDTVRLRDEVHVPDGRDLALVGHGDAGALLSAMLQGAETEVGEAGGEALPASPPAAPASSRERCAYAALWTPPATRALRSARPRAGFMPNAQRVTRVRRTPS